MDLNKLLRTQWDRTGAVALSALGALFLLIGWIGVSGSAFLAEQAPYIISGGVGGLFLLGIGATLWISADLRDEWRKLDRIEEALGDGSLRWVEPGTSTLTGVTLPPDPFEHTTELEALPPAPRTTTRKRPASVAKAAPAPRTTATARVTTAKSTAKAATTKPAAKPATRKAV